MDVHACCASPLRDAYGAFSLSSASGAACGTPRVSVLMAVFNGEHTMDAAIDSVLEQDFSDFELLIADDGSTDGSLGRLFRYAERDARIRVVVQANMGLTRTLNRLVNLAEGTYIARQDDDDIWPPGKLARQVAFMDAHPEVSILGTRYNVILPGGDVHDTPEGMRVTGDAAVRSALDRYNPFMHASVMVRREQMLECGGYDDAWDVAQDYELWLRLRAVGRLDILTDVYCLRKESGALNMGRKRRRQRLNVFRAKLRHGLLKSLPGFMNGMKDLGAALLPDTLQRSLLELRKLRS